MIQINSQHKIFIAIQPIDFRCGIDGIAALCEQKFQLNSKTGHYFLFRNRNASAIKILNYDAQGFCLLHKRLSAGRFIHWPTSSQSMLTLTPLQFQILFANGNPLPAHTFFESTQITRL